MLLASVTPADSFSRNYFFGLVISSGVKQSAESQPVRTKVSLAKKNIAFAPVTVGAERG